MYILKVNFARKQFQPFFLKADTLEEVRDRLVRESYWDSNYSTTGWEDLYFSADPWSVDEDAPEIRPLTVELLIKFAAHVFDASEHHILLVANSFSEMHLFKMAELTHTIETKEQELQDLKSELREWVIGSHDKGIPSKKRLLALNESGTPSRNQR